MLILSRKIGEKIQIGENVCITIVRIGQGGVRLGVEAPGEFSIVRSELAGESTLEEMAVEELQPAPAADGDLSAPR